MIQLRFAAAATLVVLAIACARVRPATPAGPILLAVVTWNLNAGRGDLARLVKDLSSGRLTDAPAADYVLLLQEASPDTGRDLPHVVFTPVRVSASRTSGNAIVSTRPLSDTRVIALPQERQPRAAVMGTIDIGGERLLVVNVHLENRLRWPLPGLFADNARGRQADALIAALPPGHGIAGGDMNTVLGPTERAWRRLLERFPDTPERPAPTFRDKLVLDHLFFDVPDSWIATREVLRDRYGSDHHPVLGLVRGR